MNTQKNRSKIIKELLHSADKELTDEELMKEILSTSVSENSEKSEREEKATFGQKAADGAVCGQLGVYFQLYHRDGSVDGAERLPCDESIRRVSVYTA